MNPDECGPKLALTYPETDSTCPSHVEPFTQPLNVDIPIMDVVRWASEYLHNPGSNQFYRQQSWKIIRAVILSAFRPQQDYSMDKWQETLLRKLKYRFVSCIYLISASLQVALQPVESIWF